MRVWVWVGHMWTDRARIALQNYGDRITDVSIFGWHVDGAGNLTETFAADLLLPFRERWPHIRFWLAFRNDGSNAIATALLSSEVAQTKLVNGLESALNERPWLSGIDIDLERIGGVSWAVRAETLFQRIADLAHSQSKECSAALPPLTATGSVGGENWARYENLGRILDRVAIMSYDFAWSGSAPGPVSPGFWMNEVYDWAVSQMPAEKIMMGLPLYSYFWRIHNYPAALGNLYRGDSGTYYAAWQHFTGYRAWDGLDANPDGSGSHHKIGWLAFRDNDSRSAWGFMGVYDWRHATNWDVGSATGIVPGIWDGRPYTVRYGLSSGETLWQVVDNSLPSSGASYNLMPRRVRSVTGELVAPKTGFTLTTELLKRPPVAATIIDDNAGSRQQLSDIYRVISGSWSQWSNGVDYHQYRGTGRLDFSNDFSGSKYFQIRGQFTTSGWAGITVLGLTAEVNPAGNIRLRRGSTVLASGNVSSRPVGASVGDGRFALGLRVRESTARVYFGLTENTALPKVLQVSTTPNGGVIGLDSVATIAIDHLYVGDGWWYQPREAVEVQIGQQIREVGRFPRTGIEWDYRNRFRPTTDIDEWETRTSEIGLDWVYEHWVAAPFEADRSARVRVRAKDHDVWVGRIMVVDRAGASIAFWSDSETIVHWRDRAHFDWGLSGVALWSLGQEDIRMWERMKDGELPSETKRLNL